MERLWETVGEGRGTDPAEKYQAINTVTRIAQLKNLVCLLYDIAGVSGSGYYAWLNHTEVMIHSQGFHYTHADYQRLVGDLGLVQSMSRRGNCLANAPIESFFGHLKDYITNRSCGSVEEIRERIGNYISYYNCESFQWNLKKMIPKQYRDHLIAV